MRSKILTYAEKQVNYANTISGIATAIKSIVAVDIHDMFSAPESMSDAEFERAIDVLYFLDSAKKNMGIK